MSEQWPGGFITKTPPTPAGPYEDSLAQGMWTLSQAAGYQKQNLWPIPGNQNSIVATGGTVVDYGGYRIHRFTTSDNFVITTVPSGATFELFIIGGGGGGGAGSSSGPGGGAGGAYWNTTYTCPSAGTYPIVIGAGGAGVNNSTATNGTPGGDSTAFGLTLVGGGTQNANASWNTTGGSQGTWGSGRTYSDGGCGSGVANGNELASHPKWGDTTDRGRTVYNSTGAFSGSDQANYYGYAGSLGESSAGAGAGGIGSNGPDPVNPNGANGGDGLSFNWVGTTEWMGGGGAGGCSVSGVAGTGGSGVGGNGGAGSVNGTNGAANTGSGGGGSGGAIGGTGAAGVCIIRYAI